jgi:hypothetical protein
MYASYGARIVTTGTNIWTATTSKKIWATEATFLHGHSVAVTVKDLGGTPIEGASVSFRQSEGHEAWAGFTDVNGQLKNANGYDTMLVEKEETATGVFQDWTTDGHKLTVALDGYKVNTQDITFDSDKTIIVNLELDVPSTVLYDTVLYDSTIY